MSKSNLTHYLNNAQVCVDHKVYAVWLCKVTRAGENQLKYTKLHHCSYIALSNLQHILCPQRSVYNKIMASTVHCKLLTYMYCPLQSVHTDTVDTSYAQYFCVLKLCGHQIQNFEIWCPYYRGKIPLWDRKPLSTQARCPLSTLVKLDKQDYIGKTKPAGNKVSILVGCPQ